MQGELHARESELLDKESTINVLQQSKENTLTQLETATGNKLSRIVLQAWASPVSFDLTPSELTELFEIVYNGPEVSFTARSIKPSKSSIQILLRV